MVMGLAIGLAPSADILFDLALCQKHFEHLVPEYLLQSFDVNGRRYGKHTVCVETTIGNQDVKVGMKPQEITEGLYGDHCTRYRF